MKAVTWHGKRDVRVDTVPDPQLQEPTDVIVRITSTGICGSDLHLYEMMGPFLDKGDILGHEPMGVVEEVGREVTELRPGQRVVVPFNISCGTCFMCGQGLHSQCAPGDASWSGTDIHGGERTVACPCLPSRSDSKAKGARQVAIRGWGWGTARGGCRG